MLLNLSKYLLFFILIFVLSNNVFAARDSCAVIKVRGQVTKLLPGSLIASRVKIRDRLVANTSIVTGARSFIKVRFDDDSTISLGPNGKIVIAQVKKKRAGIISLLKGGLRVNIKKKPRTSTKNKFFVRSRTAALGVRGTNFYAGYNPENRNTSLLAFDGEVEMAKSEGRLEKTGKGNSSRLLVESDKELETILESKNSSVVKRGQYSGVVQNLKKATLPVKISPVQFTLLHGNDEFVEKSSAELAKKSKKRLRKDSLLSQVDQATPLDGIYNERTGDFAARAGGFLDTKSGIYIPPDAGSKFSKSMGVYIPKKMGRVDFTTGQYVAPRGIVLDPIKGFVISKRRYAKNAALILRRERLNTAISKDIMMSGNIIGKEKRIAPLRHEIFEKDNVEFQITGGSDKITYSDVPGTDEYEIESRDYSGFDLIWEHFAAERWRPVTSFGMKYVDYGLEGSQHEQDSKKLLNLSVGGKYYVSKRFNLIGKFAIEQHHFYEMTDSTTMKFMRVSLAKMKLLTNYVIFRTNRFVSTTGLGFIVSKSTKEGDLEIGNGFGYKFDLDGRYYVSRDIWFQFGLWISAEYYDVKSDLLEASVKIASKGVKLSVGIFF